VLLATKEEGARVTADCQGGAHPLPQFWLLHNGENGCKRSAKFVKTVNLYNFPEYVDQKLALCAIHNNQLNKFRKLIRQRARQAAKMRLMPNAPRCQWRLLEARCARAARGRLRYGKRVCDKHRQSIFLVKGDKATWVGGHVSSEHLEWVGKVVRGIHRTTGYYPTSIKFRKSDGGVCWAKRHITAPSKGGAGRRILLHEIAHGLSWQSGHDTDFYKTLFKLGKRWLDVSEQIGLVEDEILYKPNGAKAAARRMRIKVQQEDVTLPEK
jgi:hypothetical protein